MSWTSIESERSLLGGLLLKSDAWVDISGIVRASDFSRDEHRIIFSAMARMGASPFDTVILSETLKSMGQLDQVGGLPYLGELARSTVSVENVKIHAEVVRRASNRRIGYKIYQKAAEEIKNSENLAEHASSVMAQLETLVHSDNSKYFTFNEAINHAIDFIDEAANAKGGVVGTPTGIPAIDKRTGGLQKNRLTILAARPAIGKTAFANQVALYAANRGFPIGILSLEMSIEELTTRAMANVYGLNVSKLSFGNEKELQELTGAISRKPISDLPIWVDTESFKLAEIIARLTEWKRKHNIQLGIIDHIGLIEGGDSQTRNDWMGKVSRSLKLTAKQLQIPLLAVSQLNRNVERDKRKPVLADLRDSGSIEQDADICIFLHVDPNEEADVHGLPLEIGILKNRVGRSGWLAERFLFDGAQQRIKEIAHMAKPYKGSRVQGQKGFDRAAN